VKQAKKAKREAYEQSKEKVLALEAQLRNMIAGEQVELHCPFCQLTTTIGQPFCCNAAADVCNAVLDHVEHLKECEIVDQVMDQLSGMPVSPLIVN
jgi:hypothetical protein